MKKLLLSAFGFAAMMASVNAQTYFSDDFTGGIGNWTAVEAAPDTDAKLWEASNEANWQSPAPTAGLGEFAISRSWTNADGALTPNNFLITTNAIDLTGVTGGTNITLSWSMGTIEADPYHAETYSVYVTASNAPATIVAATPVSTGTLSNAAQIDAYSVNLDAFAGQSVYLTFRHHDCTDMNMLLIDNVLMKTTDNIDATLTSLGMAPYVAAGNLNITGVITNSGLTPITSMDITWNDGSGPNTDNLTGLNIAGGATYNFTHTTPLAVAAGTSYSIDVDVALTGDANMADNSLSANIAGLTQIPAKVVVGEERTGTWCGWCPRGGVGLAGMEATSDFIGIAIHNGDPMTVTAYDANVSLPNDAGFPHGGVDRVIGGDPSTFNAMHTQRVSTIVPCAVNNITAVYNQATSQISVSADAEFFGNVTGNFRMSCVIVEDDIQTTGAGWSQTNYYDGGGAGTLTDPVSGFEWSTAGDPVAPTAFGGYDHVAVSLSNNDVLGDAGSLTANPTIGTQSHTFADVAGSVVTDQTFSKAHAVVMIVNATTGEIVNAAQSSISVVTSTEKIADAKFALTVFPNPTPDNADVSFTLETANNVKMEVYNAMGALVASKDAGILATGNHKMAFDGSDLNNGFYFVNLIIGDKVITKKVTLSK